MRIDAWGALVKYPLTDYEQTLRRLAVSDDRLVVSLLAQRDAVIGSVQRDEHVRPLLRLAAPLLARAVGFTWTQSSTEIRGLARTSIMRANRGHSQQTFTHRVRAM